MTDYIWNTYAKDVFISSEADAETASMMRDMAERRAVKKLLSEHDAEGWEPVWVPPIPGTASPVEGMEHWRLLVRLLEPVGGPA